MFFFIHQNESESVEMNIILSSENLNRYLIGLARIFLHRLKKYDKSISIVL